MDEIVAARVVDANLNRARESLRVLDDYARFARNDRGLCESIKQLRHRLAAAADLLPPQILLAARDTVGDVGTAVTAAGEAVRFSNAHVAGVNLKRLQEALRSAEEFGKRLDPAFGAAVEQIRYEAYTLERTVVRGADAIARLAGVNLYLLVSEAGCPLGLERTIFEAAAGGVGIVQLREKTLSDRELLARARQVRRWCREAGVLFVVNDRPDIAVLSEADGVHLGQDDVGIADARQIVGPDRLIGASTHDLAQVREAVLAGADYLGVGPTFPSKTKSFAALAGLDFVRAASEETSLPAFALGGIDADNVRDAVAAGAKRVAVAAAVAASSDPRAAAKAIRSALPD